MTERRSIATLLEGARAACASAWRVRSLVIASTLLSAVGLAASEARLAHAATTVEASSPAQARADLEATWGARLAQLDPLRPLDYLELGEEVADLARTDDERVLASQLFGLAGALDTARLGRSAMLAMASLATDAGERERALAAAELVGGRGASRVVQAVDPVQVEALSRSFSFYRRGDGRRALTALRQGGAEALLEQIGSRLPGGAEGYRRECEAMRTSGALPFDSEMVRRQFELELALRRGELRSVSLDVVLHGDEPLLEIDLSDSRALWKVDPARTWWREGGWRDSPDPPVRPNASRGT
jgi:hypothetical protein